MRSDIFKQKHYTSEEILQIVLDFYHFQSDYCLEIEKEQNLNFQTTIKEWRNICQLLEPNKLASSYYELFNLTSDISELIDLLNNEEENTLQVFCKYIAQNAIKEKVNPIMSFGNEGNETAILKILQDELEKKGIEAKGFRPSTEFAPFFNKHASVLIEIISKLAPGSLTHYEIKQSIIGRLGVLLTLCSFIILIAALMIHKVTWYVFIPFAISAILLFYKNNKKLVQYKIGGYNTVRDLIIGMKDKMDR